MTSPDTAIQRAADLLRRSQAVERLFRRDPTLFAKDEAARAAVANRLGWLDAPARMRLESETLAKFAKEVRSAGFSKALLMGMGGSSLCPEVFALSHARADGLKLRVLDNTDPDAVHAAQDWADLESTLFIVASKSGGTIEVRSFEAYFFEQAQKRFGADAGSRFIAITDPGTALTDLAERRRYRRVFENAPDIGGRYSALSYFGLVPAALIGVNVAGLLDNALAMLKRCERSDDDNPALQLAAFAGGLAAAGRDKLTLRLPSPIESFGSWIEQLVAESTGKDGVGVVPIDREPIDATGDDRAVVDVSFGTQPGETNAHDVPSVAIQVESLEHLGAEFIRWEVATALMAVVLDVNPFDEPNVTEAKQETAALIEHYEREGALPPADATSPEDDALDRLIASTKPGDYVVISAFFYATPERDAAIQRLRQRIAERTGLATTLGYGPRFLHSTGQLHKGGADNGVFLVLTNSPHRDMPIPGQKYSFANLRDAQALGDVAVLKRRQRRAAHIHLGSNVSEGLSKLEAQCQA